MKTIPHPEDVLEETLNRGVKAAMDKFSLSAKEVARIVRPHLDEVYPGGHPCLCDLPLPSGEKRTAMCFMCMRRPTRFEKAFESFNIH